MATPIKPARPLPSKPSTQYTFTTLRPLQHLPNPSRSLAYLERLRSDPGIRAVMQKYKWTVPVLAEMEPLGNTDMHSKTLGKNWDMGAMIEVRLRTDSYEGYRDYKTVRRTMAHELAHNVHNDHDRDFWDLCGKLEREIEAADWKSGGRPLTNQVFYEPPQREGIDDGVGWTGGSYTLGGEVKAKDVTPVLPRGEESRREVMARAAEERLKKLAAASGSKS